MKISAFLLDKCLHITMVLPSRTRHARFYGAGAPTLCMSSCFPVPRHNLLLKELIFGVCELLRKAAVQHQLRHDVNQYHGLRAGPTGSRVGCAEEQGTVC